MSSQSGFVRADDLPEISGPEGVGLGDIAAFLTRWTGIAWAVRISGKSCGCNARRHRWNRYRLRLPFRKV
jgi:hypothetical protein